MWWIEKLCARADHKLMDGPPPEKIDRLTFSLEQDEGKILATLIGERKKVEAIVNLPSSVEFKHGLWRVGQNVREEGCFSSSTPMSLFEAELVVGHKLFDAFFPGELGACLVDFCQQAQQRIVTPVLQIIAEDASLLEYPFELLKPSEQNFLCFDGLVIIRTPRSVKDHNSPKADSLPLEVLMMVSAPEDNSSLNYEKEQELIIKAFDSEDHPNLKIKGRLNFIEDGTFAAFSQRVNELKPQVVHISAHGTDQGEIIFEDNEGKSCKQSVEEISKSLRSKELRLVFLSCCHSSRLCMQLLESGIPVVLAMQKAHSR